MDNNNLTKRQQLCNLIQQWNTNRLPLFALSEPSEDMEFYGVMRFYYKEPGEKVTTKCIRVSSLATTLDVIEALIEKFKPDMKMLNQDISYEILEIHENGEERKLDIEEHPLFVQLAWHKNDREGRFLLRSTDTTHYLPLAALQFDSNGSPIKRSTNKRFSKRSKKENKFSAADLLSSDDAAKQLYEELPQTQFTRTISNPEAVMKKRREQKLANRLEEIRHTGSNGGTLKIYGSDIMPTKPYVTLLVGEDDTAFNVLQSALDKYGLQTECVDDFVLVELTFASGGVLGGSLNELKIAGQHNERCLLDDECPLSSLSQNLTRRGVETAFVIRRRPANFPPQHISNQVSPPVKLANLEAQCGSDPALLPLVNNGLQLTPFLLQKGLNEVGSDFSISGLMLRSPSIQPRHCVFDFDGFSTTLTALDTHALVEVNGNLLNCSVVLHDSDIVRLGGIFEFVFRRSFSVYQQIENRANNNQQCDKIPTYTSDTTQFDAVTDAVTIIPRQPTSDMELPGLLEVSDQVAEEHFLQQLVEKYLPTTHSFRLSPSFCFYMVCRMRLMPPDHFHRSNSLYYKERLRSIPAFVSNLTNRIYHIVHVNPHNKELSLFWLANLSELLHIIKRDNDLNALIGPHQQAQIMEIVERCLELHVETCKVEIQNCMPAFLDLNNASGDDARNIVYLLNELVMLYRRSSLNPALIIQSFSQLFHYINMYSFNWLIGPTGNMNLTRIFGIHFRSRLQAIYQWAEKKGLEFSAECHMDRLAQALKILITPKTVDQLGILGSTCYKLNSIQVSFLLEYYLPDHNEMPVSRDLIDSLVHLAQTQADRSVHEEGQRVQLEEFPTLGLPFLFPQDGYVVENQRGIPSDMLQLISDLERAGICRLIQCNSLSGSWSVHFGGLRQNTQFLPETIIDTEYASVQAGRFPNSTLTSNISQLSLNNKRSQPQRIFVQIKRPNGAGIGLSIVAAQGAGDRYLGIYVKKVVEGSIAYREGHLETGDQLLSVNNFSLLNVTQEIAAQKIAEAGTFVQLEVAKHAASFNGLDLWLKNTNFVRRPYPVANNYQQQIPPDFNRHYRSASASELYSQADTASISSNQVRHQMRYRSAQKPQIIHQERPPVTTRMSASNLEPPPVYSAINSTRSSSTVPFNVNTSYSAVPRLSSPQKTQSTSSFPVSGRRSAPLFNNPIEAEHHSMNKNLFTDYQNGNSQSSIRSPANLPLTTKTQKLLQSGNVYKLPFLNEINTKFIEINSNRDKQSSTSRVHQDEFVDEIDQLEQTANSCDSMQRTAFRTSSPDERHKKRVQFAAEISADDSKENGHTSTSSNASDSPRSEQPPQQKSSISQTVEFNTNAADEEEDNEPRTQILGKHEIYNDPRQRRLNELQAKSLKPIPDGSNLNFRDKMKMFASQLGEHSPKDKHKISSAQREIEIDP